MKVGQRKVYPKRRRVTMLDKLPRIPGNKTPKKRVGRGGGSGKGFHTTGRGHKGQNARRGHGIPVGFEGGQVPLYKKIPEIRGFKRPRQRRPAVVNLGSLNVFKEGETVSPQSLLEKGLITKKDINKGVKILGQGRLKVRLNFSEVSFSESAKKAIENA